MVKKKSHEERHDESMPDQETQENQTNTESDASGEKSTGGETVTEVKSQAEEELLGKLTEMQDRYLRLSAEFDNYRRRTLREKIELSQAGGESVIRNLLPIIDDLDRAMNSMRLTDDCNAVKAGLELIYSKINDFLKQNGVREIEAMNEPFNSDLHEAVTTLAVEDEKLKGIILDVTQKGYTLNEKVIRFPKVVVGE
ncbi:MAG: nucleotide exchange factor GrpE [Bacteroidales bacterium]|jgi:molecular chaperone GrpE|nr:nucleotide exchange factor GrpE [Bacteroidales bacterium]